MSHGSIIIASGVKEKPFLNLKNQSWRRKVITSGTVEITLF